MSDLDLLAVAMVVAVALMVAAVWSEVRRPYKFHLKVDSVEVWANSIDDVRKMLEFGDRFKRVVDETQRRSDMSSRPDLTPN